MNDAASSNRPPELRPGIRIGNHGPYIVSGGVTLTVRTPVIDNHGDAVGWTAGPTQTARATYVLCRCGHSEDKPFCDGSHRKLDFKAPA